MDHLFKCSYHDIKMSQRYKNLKFKEPVVYLGFPLLWHTKLVLLLSLDFCAESMMIILMCPSISDTPSLPHLLPSHSYYEYDYLHLSCFLIGLFDTLLPLIHVNSSLCFLHSHALHSDTKHSWALWKITVQADTLSHWSSAQQTADCEDFFPFCAQSQDAPPPVIWGWVMHCFSAEGWKRPMVGRVISVHNSKENGKRMLCTIQLIRTLNCHLIVR